MICGYEQPRQKGIRCSYCWEKEREEENGSIWSRKHLPRQGLVFFLNVCFKCTGFPPRLHDELPYYRRQKMPAMDGYEGLTAMKKSEKGVKSFVFLRALDSRIRDEFLCR